MGSSKCRRRHIEAAHRIPRRIEVAFDPVEPLDPVLGTDLLAEEHGRLQLADQFESHRPQVALVFHPSPLPGRRERLAVMDDRSVRAITLVLGDSDIVNTPHSRFGDLPDEFPSVIAVDGAGAVPVRDHDDIGIPLINFPALDDVPGAPGRTPD
jgi:hypothetical protein